MHLLGLIDDCEGFRVLLQDRKHPWFVYGVFGEVVFHQRCKALRDCRYSWSAPPVSGVGNLLYRVYSSRLVTTLREQEDVETMGAFSLEHYALCLPEEQRIDIVSNGSVSVRLVGSNMWGSGRSGESAT